MICPLTIPGSEILDSYFGVPTDAGRPPIRARNLSTSGLAGTALLLDTSGSVSKQNRSGLERALGVARRISWSPGVALVAIAMLMVTVSGSAGLAVRFGGLLSNLARILSRSVASSAVQTFVPDSPLRA